MMKKNPLTNLTVWKNKKMMCDLVFENENCVMDFLLCQLDSHSFKLGPRSKVCIKDVDGNVVYELSSMDDIRKYGLFGTF